MIATLQLCLAGEETGDERRKRRQTRGEEDANR